MTLPTPTYSPARAMVELAAQHEALRGMMDRCEELADALDAGRTGPTQLAREVARLRLAFDAHNQFEEKWLRPALLAAGPLGDVRAEHLLAEHVGEHREMRAQLGSEATADLRRAIYDLRSHLEAEERHFGMTARALRGELQPMEHGA